LRVKFGVGEVGRERVLVWELLKGSGETLALETVPFGTRNS
jgi:hypothetical protein